MSPAPARAFALVLVAVALAGCYHLGGGATYHTQAEGTSRSVRVLLSAVQESGSPEAPIVRVADLEGKLAADVRTIGLANGTSSAASSSRPWSCIHGH